MTKNKKYDSYLLYPYEIDKDVTISKIIMNLYVEKIIDLKTAYRLKRIYSFLGTLSSADKFAAEEYAYYKTTDKLTKIKMEIAYLLKELELYAEINDTKSLELYGTINRLSNIYETILNKELSDTELDDIINEIICIEIDNGIDIRFLVSADNYLKSNIKNYFIKKG